MQDHIFKKLFEAAEIAKFSPKERNTYEESLKYYRDIKNVVDTSREEGRQEGKEEGEKEKAIKIAKHMITNGESIEKIMMYTDLSKQEIEQL